MGTAPDDSRVDPIAFRSDEERFERLSFFRIRDIERLLGFTTQSAEDAPRMLYLGADVLSEAIDLVRTTAYHAAKRHVELRLIVLDVGGMEPESQITAVLEQVEKQVRMTAGPIRGLLDRLKIKPPGGIVSIDLPTVGQMVEEFSAVPSVAGPEERPARLLTRVLQEIARESLTLVVVKESAALNDVIRDALYTVLRTATDFVLIQCCDRGYEVPKRLLSPDYEVFELCPLEAFEMKGLFQTRPMRTAFDYGAACVGNVGSFFQPHRYPPELLDWMHRATQGYPVGLSWLWLRLLRAGLIDQDGEGIWNTTQPLGAVDFAQVFAESSFALIDRKVGALPGHLREDGLAFLRIAALSGPVAPVALILDYLGITEAEERDDLIDAIDRCFGTLDDLPVDEAESGWGEENPAVFANAGFSHEGLPKSLVYVFRSDLFRNSVIVHAEVRGRRLAREFLEFLDANRPADTRTFALMCRHLAVHAGSAERAAEQGRRLSWWVGILERGDLSEQLRAALRAGKVDAETLWQYYNRARNAKPNQLALALLETFYVPEYAEASSLWDPAIVPMGRLGYFFQEHATQLLDAKEVSAAAVEVSHALEFTEPGTQDRANLLCLAILITRLTDKSVSMGYLDEFLGMMGESDFGFGPLMLNLMVEIGASLAAGPEVLADFPSIRKYLARPELREMHREILKSSLFLGDSKIADMIADLHQAERDSGLGQHVEAIAAYQRSLDELEEPAAIVFVLSSVSGHLIGCTCEEGSAILARGLEMLRAQERVVSSRIAPMEIVVRTLDQGRNRELFAQYLGIALEMAEDGLRNEDVGRDQEWVERKIAEWKGMEAKERAAGAGGGAPASLA